MPITEFILSEWELSFAEDIFKNANNINVANKLRNIFPYPYTLEDAREWIEFNNNIDKQFVNNRAIIVDGKAVGSIGIEIQKDVYCKSAELGYWLGEKYWGKGIMTRAIVELCHYVFINYDVIRIFAEPFAENIGSRRALEKAGFHLEGIKESSIFKNGVIQDSCMYALIKKDTP